MNHIKSCISVFLVLSCPCMVMFTFTFPKNSAGQLGSWMRLRKRKYGMDAEEYYSNGDYLPTYEATTAERQHELMTCSGSVVGSLSTALFAAPPPQYYTVVQLPTATADHEAEPAGGYPASAPGAVQTAPLQHGPRDGGYTSKADIGREVMTASCCMISAHCLVPLTCRLGNMSSFHWL